MNAITPEQWAIVIGSALVIVAMGVYINFNNRNRW